MLHTDGKEILLPFQRCAARFSTSFGSGVKYGHKGDGRFQKYKISEFFREFKGSESSQNFSKIINLKIFDDFLNKFRYFQASIDLN